MNSVTEVVPAGSTVSRETMSKRFFKICLSDRNYRFNHWLGMPAFGWAAVRVTKWLIA